MENFIKLLDLFGLSSIYDSTLNAWNLHMFTKLIQFNWLDSKETRPFFSMQMCISKCHLFTKCEAIYNLFKTNHRVLFFVWTSFSFHFILKVCLFCSVAYLDKIAHILTYLLWLCIKNAWYTQHPTVGWLHSVANDLCTVCHIFCRYIPL